MVLLPACARFDDLLQPFGRPGAELTTLQRLEARGETRCYRRMAICHLASFVFDPAEGRGEDGAGARGPERSPWDAMQFVVSRSGDESFKRAVAARAAAWRVPRLLLPSAAVGESSAPLRLRLLLVDRRGRRKMRNVQQLARACTSAPHDAVSAWAVRAGLREPSPHRALDCFVHSFGAAGFAADAAAVRRADLMAGTHGADLVNGLCMHRGASLLEVRGAGYAELVGLTKEWHRDFFALDDAIHHYTLQLGANDTLPPPIDAATQSGYDTSWAYPQNWDVRTPPRALREFVARAEAVGADGAAYRRLRAHGATVISWT
mmetsp:Transcript_81178/g.243296  ORF Transcript_81178/g.243296 Transcript_81178/m.243296 type:complete len:319 (-) Transcript_81178:51-1007(-)